MERSGHRPQKAGPRVVEFSNILLPYHQNLLWAYLYLDLFLSGTAGRAGSGARTAEPGRGGGRGGAETAQTAGGGDGDGAAADGGGEQRAGEAPASDQEGSGLRDHQALRHAEVGAQT